MSKIGQTNKWIEYKNTIKFKEKRNFSVEMRDPCRCRRSRGCTWVVENFKSLENGWNKGKKAKDQSRESLFKREIEISKN